MTTYSPVWLLVKKELRLQQLPLALAALYALVLIAAAWSTTLVSDTGYRYALGTATMLYAGLLCILIGSSASAGERQIGTLEWQVLLPIAVWKQWAVKVGMVLGLAMILALGLPAALLSVSRLIRVDAVSFSQVQPALIAVMLLTTGSLFISSRCRSGLWALLMSISFGRPWRPTRLDTSDPDGRIRDGRGHYRGRMAGVPAVARRDRAAPT